MKRDTLTASMGRLRRIKEFRVLAWSRSFLEGDLESSTRLIPKGHPWGLAFTSPDLRFKTAKKPFFIRKAGTKPLLKNGVKP